MKIFLLKLVCFIAISSCAYATNQVPEEILIGNERFKFQEYPLSQYVSFTEFRKVYPSISFRYCSAAERGYLGRWTISDGNLYLKELLKNPCGFEKEKEEKFDLRELFSESDSQGSAKKANWYSGEITIPVSDYQIIENPKVIEGHKLIERQVIIYKFEKGKVIEKLEDKQILKIKNLTSSKTKTSAELTRTPHKTRRPF